MAKKRKRKYSRGAGTEVKREMHRYKRGTAKSGRGGKGGKVKSRKQAIAIGLSKARKKGKKVPRKTTRQNRRQLTTPRMIGGPIARIARPRLCLRVLLNLPCATLARNKRRV